MNKYILNNKTIVLASHNKGKVGEFKSLFAGSSVNLITSSDLGIKDVEETGKTFEENSLIKAESIPNQYIVLSDDSGLRLKHLIINQEYFLPDMPLKKEVGKTQ